MSSARTSGGPPAGPASAGVPDADPAAKKRMVRCLLAGGRGLAEEWGFRVTNNPANLFQLLYLSVLLARTTDHRRAVRAAQALREGGGESPARFAATPTRTSVLRNVDGRRNADELAATLGELAARLVRRYQGDLRRLRTSARQDPARERELLTELPGVDDAVVDLFFREVQAVWREVMPFVDRRAMTAARRLGLARSVDELSTLAGSGDSERLAWLVGALAKVDLEDRYQRLGG